MKKRSDEPKVQVLVKGETGEVVVQVFEDYVIMTVRQPHHERFAEVRLTDSQVTAIQDAFNQLGSGLMGGDDDD